MFIAAITVILYMAFILPFLWSGYYELREDYLYIRIGYIFTKVKYHKIIDIQESNGLTNSFSMTSDRVTIQTGKSKIFNVIHVGPEDKERFIYELSVRCPNLKPKEY